jgi:hypothetical protein
MDAGGLGLNGFLWVKDFQNGMRIVNLTWVEEIAIGPAYSTIRYHRETTVQRADTVLVVHSGPLLKALLGVDEDDETDTQGDD